MRAVVQRVDQATVRVEDRLISSVASGLLVYLGIHHDDTKADIDYIVNKIIHLRIFPDAEGRMNRSVRETQGEILVVSQFTLYGDVRKGRRPTYHAAAPETMAKDYVERVIQTIADYGLSIQGGEFKAHMHVESINNGPVNILLDSSKLL